MNFYSLWLITCTVKTIIPKTDILGKKIYFYKLLVRRNDDVEWFVTTTFDKIETFRYYAVKFVKEIVNIPFPRKHLLEYIPFIGKLYSDENYDILIEKKYILDNFFQELLKNQQVYKLDYFKRFFTED
jgi:hypothetical protein